MNALYRYYILSIVYSYILADGTLFKGTLHTETRTRAAMAEPLHTMCRSGCVIILAVLRSISSGLSRKNSSSIIVIQFKKAAPKFARGIESYLMYMVGYGI
jgi:hypothetical protein